MKPTHYIILILLITACWTTLSQAAYEVQQINEGVLTQGFVNSIVQLQSKKIAIGTNNGFNIYNGQNCLNFYKSNKPCGLSGGIIYDIVETKDNKICLATENGINLFDPRFNCFEQIYYDTNNLHSRSNTFLSLALDSAGHIWAGNDNGELLHFDPTTKKVLHKKKIQTTAKIKSVNNLLLDTKGNIWATLQSGTIARLDTVDYQIQYYDVALSEERKNDLRPNILSDMCLDEYGTVWISTYAATILMKPINTDSFVTAPFGDNILKHPTHNKHVDLNYIGGDSLLTCYNKSAYSYNIKTHQQSTIFTQSVDAATINNIIKDKDGYFWMGLSGYGLIHYYNPETHFRVLSTKTSPNLSVTSLRGIYEDTDGSVFTGGYIGLNKISADKRSISYLQNNIIPFKIIQDLTDTNCLLIATESTGIKRYNKRANTILTLDFIKDQPQKYQSKKYNDLVFIDSTHLLIATTTGAFIYDFRTQRSKRIDLTRWNLSLAEITCAHIDRNQNFWLGIQKNGVLFINPSTKKQKLFRNDSKTEIHRIADNTINSFFESGDTIFVSTGSGVELINKNTIIVLPRLEAPEIANSFVTATIKDDSQQLWIATYNGLYSFNLSNQYVTRYYTEDGIANNEFNRYSYHKGKSGTIYFGGISGITWFKDCYNSKQKAHKPYLSKYFEYNEPVTLDTLIEYKQNIIIRPEINMFSFQISTVNLSSIRSSNYVFKLKGYDNNWLKTDEHNKINFANIPPGKYVLQVATLIGNQKTEIIKKTIIVQAHFYELMIFKLAVILLILGLLLLFVYIRTHQDKKRNVLLEKAVKEKTKELQQSKDKLELANSDLEHVNTMKNRLISIVSHDIKNPLSIIQTSMEICLTSFDSLPKETTLQMIRTGYDGARQLSYLQSDLFNWAKSMESKFTVNFIDFNLHQIVQNSILLHKHLADAKNITFINSINSEIEVYSDIAIIATTTRNLISNALKFTDYGGNIELLAEEQSTEIKFTIKDNGIGIEKETLKQLQEKSKITSQKGTIGEAGTGLGLTICHDLLAQIEIELKIKSELKKGTGISINLPKRKQ